MDKSIEAFGTHLQLRAKTYEFGNQKESMICDRIVIECQEAKLQKRMLREPDLNLTLHVRDVTR